MGHACWSLGGPAGADVATPAMFSLRPPSDLEFRKVSKPADAGPDISGADETVLRFSFQFMGGERKLWSRMVCSAGARTARREMEGRTEGGASGVGSPSPRLSQS